VSRSAADRVIDHLGPALALQPRKRFREDTVLLVDGTLVPTRDDTVAKQSKNSRCSRNHQVVIEPTLSSSPSASRCPATRNDCTAWELSGVKDAVGHRWRLPRHRLGQFSPDDGQTSRPFRSQRSFTGSAL
jgi:hypothetical protein